MDFQNPEVAAKYKPVGDADLHIMCSAYHGPLSRITLRGAEFLIKTKDPHIEEKKASQPPTKATNNQ